MWGCIIIWKYVVKRLLQLILILFGITLLSFALMQTASGDTVDAIQQQMGTSMSEEAKTALRHEMGLNQPFIIQYFQWVGKAFTGNMGYSYIKNQEVFPMFMQALPNTLLLTLSSIVTTILISIPLGIWSAVKQNKIDRLRYTCMYFYWKCNAELFYCIIVDLCICFAAALVSCYG